MSAVARIPGTTGNEEPDKRSLRVRSPQAEVDVDARGEAMSQLVSLLDDRFARIDRQVEHVLHLLGGSGPAALPTASRTRAAPVAISCLGPFQFHVNGVPVDNWRSSKARSLFQYMVNHRGRPIPRDTLIQALWPT